MGGWVTWDMVVMTAVSLGQWQSSCVCGRAERLTRCVSVCVCVCSVSSDIDQIMIQWLMLENTNKTSVGGGGVVAFGSVLTDLILCQERDRAHFVRWAQPEESWPLCSENLHLTEERLY